MLLSLLELWILLQPEATGGSAPTGGGGGGAPPAGCESVQGVGMMVAFIAIFYFLFYRPQAKRQAEQDRMLKALKKGDIVRTSGGIRGEITDLNDRDVTLMVADKIRINVLRAHIAGPDVAAAPATSTTEKKADKKAASDADASSEK